MSLLNRFRNNRNRKKSKKRDDMLSLIIAVVLRIDSCGICIQRTSRFNLHFNGLRISSFEIDQMINKTNCVWAAMSLS